jgi:hypothetical protein
MIIAVIERYESRSGVHSKCPVDTKRPSQAISYGGVTFYFRAECGVYFGVRRSSIFFDEGGRAFRAYRDILSSLVPPDFAHPGYLQTKSKAKAAFRAVK